MSHPADLGMALCPATTQSLPIRSTTMPSQHVILTVVNVRRWTLVTRSSLSKTAFVFAPSQD